jgi:ketosteroid isomerase-like protein
MKKYLMIALLLFTVGILHAQDRERILKLMNDQQTAWNNGDIETFMQGYWKSDSLVFVGKSAPLYGWQSTIDRYRKAYPDKDAMGQLKFGVIKLEILDSRNAFMLGSWHLDRKTGPIGGYFTLWFRKIKGEWKIVCDHTS